MHCDGFIGSYPIISVRIGDINETIVPEVSIEVGHWQILGLRVRDVIYAWDVCKYQYALLLAVSPTTGDCDGHPLGKSIEYP